MVFESSPDDFAPPHWITPDLRPEDRVLYSNRNYGIGELDLPTTSTKFEESGPYSAYYFAFPKTVLRITDRHGREFTSTSCQINCYSAGARIRRQSIQGHPDATTYLFIGRHAVDTDTALAEMVAGLADRQVFCSPQIYLQLQALLGIIKRYPHALPLIYDDAILSILSSLSEKTSDSCLTNRSKTRNGVRARRARERVEYVKEKLHSAHTASWKLDDLANEVHVTPWHLAREFRAFVGQSIHQFLIQVRLVTSLAPVAAGKRSIASLAADLGFAHHSHFTRAFSGTFGCTPSQYRQADLTTYLKILSGQGCHG